MLSLGNIKKSGAAISIAVLFFIVVVVMTYPLVFKINSSMPGFFSSDESFAVLWDAWKTKHSFLNGISMARTDYVAYPYGIDFYAGQPIGYLWSIIRILFSILTTPALSYNLQVILNFFLTAFFTYLLVFDITGNRYAAFLSGIAFGFCPYMFVRSWQHMGETYQWVMPLFLLSLFRLKNQNNYKTKVFFILSFILTTINFNGIYYTSIILGTFLIYSAIKWNQNKAYIKQISGLLSICMIFLIPQFFLIFKNILLNKNSLPSAQNIYLRPFEDLFIQSAKPLSYFLPAVTHPVFGKFTEQFIGSQLYGMSFTEHTLYLGWTPIILAFIAFRGWRKNKKLRVVSYELRVTDKEDFYIGYFVYIAIVAWFFSQPPWWRFGPLKVYMPSFFMYRVLPMFRAYCRFGVVVMLAVAILAGFGLKSVLDKFNSQKKKIAITALFCGLILFEFWNYPPFKVIDISKAPEVYYWLKSEPQDVVVAEYPLDINGSNEMYKLYQTKHTKKMINATVPGTYAHRIAQIIVKLSEPNTTGVLKWMGVKYVLVHKEGYMDSGLIEDSEELDRISQNPGLKFIKTFPVQECPQRDIMCIQKTGPIDVYEVVVSPIKPKIEEE